MKTKVCSFTVSTEGEFLRQGSFECTLNILSPIV